MQQEDSHNWRLVVLATALSGASCLVYEIIASRILLLFFGSALNSVTIVLIVFLGGLALGATLMTVYKKYITDNGKIFSLLQFIIGFYGILILSQFINLPSLFDALSYFIPSHLGVQFFGGTIFVFIPTVLLGAVFPLAISMINSENNNNINNRTSWLYALDILGSIIGSGIAGFLILPNYGNTSTIVFAASLNILSAILIFPKKNKIKVIYLILSILFLITIWLIIRNQPIYSVAKNYLYNGISYSGKDNISYIEKKDILWQKPSQWGIVTVRKKESEKGQDRILMIDNREQCSLFNHQSESLIATGTLKGIKNANVLNIGLGCGFTLASILDSNPKQVTVAEINPIVYQSAELFKEYTNNSINDKRVNIIIQDGAEFLRTTDKKFDAIIIDIENPQIANSSPLYTVEYFRYAKEHLNKNGRIALWGYYSLDPRYLKSLVETFKAVFNNVVFSEFANPPYVYLFIASDGLLSVETIDTKSNAKALETSLKAIEDIHLNTLDYPALEKYSNIVFDVKYKK